MYNQTAHLWIRCHAKFFCGKLVMIATIHNRTFTKNDKGELEAGACEEKVLYEYMTVMTHNDVESVNDVEVSSLDNGNPLLEAIKGEYPASRMRYELRMALGEHFCGGTSDLPLTKYGALTHERDLEPLSY